MANETAEEPTPLEQTPFEPAPPPAPAARAPRLGRERIAWLLLLLLVVLVLAGSSPFWAPRLAGLLPWSERGGDDRVAAAVAPLEQRLDQIARQQAALDQRLAQSEDATRGAGATAAAVNAIEERVAALEQRPRGGDPAALAAIETRLQSLAQSTAQDSERLGKLEARRNATTGERGDAALLLAIGQLRAVLLTSHPFAAELGAVQALSRHDPSIKDAIEPLAAAADKGIPSLPVLSERFEQEVVPAALQAAPAPPSEGWGAWIMAKLGRFVTIRRAADGGATARDPADAALAEAEAALKAGDLAGAVAAAERLSPRDADAARAWLADAHRRLAAEQAVARLTEVVTARLAEADRAGASEEH